MISSPTYLLTRPRRPGRNTLVRDEPLARLAMVWRRQSATAATVACLEGRPGLGRSTILADATALAARDGALTLRAAARPEDRDRPFHLVRRLLAPAVDDLDLPAVLSADILDATLTGRLARPGRMIVLAVDDAHWADPSSLSWLARAAQPAGPRWHGIGRVTVLLTMATLPAPQASPELSRLLTGAERVVLTPLDRAECAGLTAQVIGADPSDVLVDCLLAASGGHPRLLIDLLSGREC